MEHVVASSPQEASGSDEAGTGPYASTRGKFEFFHAPDEIRPERTVEDVGEDELQKAVDAWDYSGLVDDEHPEEEVRGAVVDMFRAMTGGSAVTVLFAQYKRFGMSVGHAWFGPNYPLVRHSHPLYGDCLYYVVTGELHLGKRVLRAGDGFFVPNGMPYKYRAGPEGVEVLEFRAGGGTKGAQGNIVHESSVEAIRRLAETARQHQPSWKPPARISSGSLLHKAPADPPG